MPTMVLIDRFRFINRFPCWIPRSPPAGSGFFHVRGTSCVDERVLFGPGRRLLNFGSSPVDHLTFLRRTPVLTGIGADIRMDTA
jgi:hypothetical protein